MTRMMNLAFIAATGLVCLGLYHIAEEARVAGSELAMTERSINREQVALTVLGAEWARVTQPARIAALAQRHLAFADNPAIQLSSLALLPRKDAPMVARNAPARDAKALAAAPVESSGRLKVVAFRAGT